VSTGIVPRKCLLCDNWHLWSLHTGRCTEGPSDCIQPATTTLLSGWIEGNLIPDTLPAYPRASYATKTLATAAARKRERAMPYGERDPASRFTRRRRSSQSNVTPIRFG
jgi:hypothetical protein